jgi:hypothetical protein
LKKWKKEIPHAIFYFITLYFILFNIIGFFLKTFLHERTCLFRIPLRAGVWNRLTLTSVLSILDNAMALLLSSPASKHLGWNKKI